jgi:hypothetical protein
MTARGSIRHPQDLGGLGQAPELCGFGEDFELEQPVHFCENRKRDLQILTFISVFCKAKWRQQSTIAGEEIRKCRARSGTS